MKKLVALLLATMMVLASVSALAADSSDTKKTTYIPAPKPGFDVVALGTIGQQYHDDLQNKIDNGENLLDAFSPEAAEALKATLGDAIQVKEMAGIVLKNWSLSQGDQFLVLTFATEYKAGQPVAAVLGTVKGEVVTENVLVAEVEKDYEVTVYVPVTVLEQMVTADECFVIIVNTAA